MSFSQLYFARAAASPRSARGARSMLMRPAQALGDGLGGAVPQHKPRPRLLDHPPERGGGRDDHRLPAGEVIEDLVADRMVDRLVHGVGDQSHVGLTVEVCQFPEPIFPDEANLLRDAALLGESGQRGPDIAVTRQVEPDLGMVSGDLGEAADQAVQAALGAHMAVVGEDAGGLTGPLRTESKAARSGVLCTTAIRSRG